MTMPSGDNSGGWDLTGVDGGIVGAGLSALLGRTESNVRAAKKTEVQGNTTWGAASNQLFAGLDSTLPFALALIKGLVSKFFPGITIPDWSQADFLADPSSIVGEALGLIREVPILGDLIELITGVEDGDTSDLGTWALGIRNAFSGIDLTGDPGAVLASITGALGGLIDALVNGGQPLNVMNLFGQIPKELFGWIPASAIGAGSPDLLNNGGFDGTISMDGVGGWTWDATVGHTTLGSAKITANGSLNALLSNSVDVQPGQVLAPSVWAKSSSYTGSGTPIRLAVRTYKDGAVVGTTVITSTAGPGSTWTQLTGSYTVPDDGTVDAVRLRLVVDTTATGGTIWFDDATLSKPGAGPFDAIFGALTNGDTITNLFPDLFDALKQIPSLNVLGVGGPGSIGGSIQSTWDQWISGLVDTVGSGAGLSDLFNVGRDVSSRATLGQFSWDILGIRGNRSLNSGFLPTSISNIGLDKVALASVAPTVPVTKTTALMTYHRIEQSMDLGVVSWQGFGVTNVTNAYVNIYKMDTSTGVNSTLLHTSADIIGLLTGGASPVPVVYSLPTAITGLLPGDVVGTEINVRGTGTHNVAGAATWLADQSVYPRRYSSVRDSSTTLSPSSFTPTYTSNVPFVEIGVSASAVAIPRSPETTLLNAAGSSTLPIPSWANTVQVIAVGGGGGGCGGSTYGISGEGGDAGVWSTASWIRGTDFTGTPSISITVGAGGAAGVGTIGGNGGSSTAAITGHTVTATGGEGGDAFEVGGVDKQGASPGNQMYDGVPYVGGAQQNTFGGAGAAPGGGGAGGNYVSFQPGGAAAPGAVWVRFKQ